MKHGLLHKHVWFRAGAVPLPVAAAARSGFDVRGGRRGPVAEGVGKRYRGGCSLDTRSGAADDCQGRGGGSSGKRQKQADTQGNRGCALALTRAATSGLQRGASLARRTTATAKFTVLVRTAAAAVVLAGKQAGQRRRRQAGEGQEQADARSEPNYRLHPRRYVSHDALSSLGLGTDQLAQLTLK